MEAKRILAQIENGTLVDLHITEEKSIYISDGYGHHGEKTTYAVYAMRWLPSHTASPVNPVRVHLKGGFSTKKEASAFLVELGEMGLNQIIEEFNS